MIELFPERVLDGSIHTAILVGILVLWMMTETLGYVFAGFVVTGYLAAIGIVQPMSLVAICLEAVLTYGLVLAVGVGPGKIGLWSRVFGRERFLLFILASLPVRLVVEGLAAPSFEMALRPLFDDPVWRGSSFFGIGIVLVPLLANTFWKPGLARGGMQVLLGTAITMFVMKGILIPFTNFQFSGFEMLFERVAVDFLASPKAYMLLVTTAFVAAHNNVRFGWDFGGVLVPALLAIVALTPVKLVTTVGEIIVLVLLYRGMVKLPFVRDLNLEGPRRIVSMYVLSYALHWGVAVAALRFAPDTSVTDFYGFGYLLTSLVALRCYQKRNTARVLSSLLITVFQGLALALLMSIALAWLMPPQDVDDVDPMQDGFEEPLARSVMLAYASVRTELPLLDQSENDMQTWTRALQRLARGESPDAFAQATATFHALGLDVRWAARRDGSRCLAVRSPRPNASMPSGLPSLWWCGGSGPGLYVPRPVGDADALWTAAWLASEGQVSFVVVAGIDDSHTSLIGSGDRRIRARYRRIREALGQRTVLVVRTQPSGESYLDPRSALTTRALFPEGISASNTPLGPLESLPVKFESEHHELDDLWQTLRRQDGMLTLSIEGLSPMMAPAPDRERVLEGLLADVRRRADRPRIDPSTPSSRVLTAEYAWGAVLRYARSPSRPVGALRWLTEQVGLEMSVARDARGNEYWVLDETVAAPTGWGTWVVRPEAPGPWLIGAPFSAGERGTAEAAELMYQRLEGEVLWISGHGKRFGAGNALSSRLGELPTAQLALREALQPDPDPDAIGPASRLLLVRMQTRRGPDTPPVVISRGEEAVLESHSDPLMDVLGPQLRDWPGLGFHGGQPATAAMGASGQFPVRYLNALTVGQVAVAWFAPSLLAEITGSEMQALRRGWYEAAGVEVRRVDSLFDLMDEKRRVDQPLLDTLRFHVTTLDDGSLADLAALTDARFVVLDTGTRMVGSLWGDGWVCTSVAGAPTGQYSYPFDGCWGTP